MVATGGARRQDSVAAGVRAAAEMGAAWVLVHDGARPLLPPRLCGEVLAAAKRTGCAVAALPASDTVKEEDGGGLVRRTLDRGSLWLVQTPQGFSLELLQEALAWGDSQGLTATDEAGLVERMGRTVELVMGAKENLKVTTPQDMELAQAWLSRGAAGLRTGQGLDVHRLVTDRPLILAGVPIPFELGLMGHSDADVAVHALIDALLAAAGLGDIGGMFPDSDPAWAGADSMGLLALVVERLAREGWRPAQAGVTIVAQRPKLAPHVPAMRANLAQALGLNMQLVNVAATTTEGLGPAGRGEGIAATALAVLAGGALGPQE